MGGKIIDSRKLNDDEITFLINKYLVSYVYNAARVEGIITTLLQTEKLVDDDNAGDLDITSVNKMKNLKDAYKALAKRDFLDLPNSIETLAKINLLIEGRGIDPFAGRIRNFKVGITGTSYKPGIPNEYKIQNQILDIVESKKSYIEKGLDLYCFIMREQVFTDGNKRTANIFANKFLLEHRQGIVTISENKKDEFFTLLVDFYETNDDAKLKTFLYENCFINFYNQDKFSN